MTIARCIHDLVQEQANSTPGATALRSGQVELTYRDLDVRSNQIANLLRSAGVGLEVPVGVCMNRSADFVLAVLGILKAGGAYVPIDPSYPANRISMLLQESAVSLVLTHSAV